MREYRLDHEPHFTSAGWTRFALSSEGFLLFQEVHSSLDSMPISRFECSRASIALGQVKPFVREATVGLREEREVGQRRARMEPLYLPWIDSGQ